MLLGKLTRLLGLVVVLGCGWSGPLMASEAVAVMVQVTGDVRVQRAGKPTAAPGTPGLQLMAGDSVLVPAGGRAVLLYRTGRVATVAQSLRLAAPQGARSGVFAQATTTLAQIATTDARTQPNRQGMIRPIAGTAVPISPRNGLTVLDPRPTLVWFRVPEAEGYMLQIRAVGEAPRRFEVGGDTAWTPPAGVFRAGGEYEWNVGQADEGRVGEPQRFRVASRAQRTNLQKQLRRLSAAGLDVERDGLFLAALIYRDAGFPYEALRALDRLEAVGNGTGRAFYTLRGEVYNALGRLDDAARAFELADAAEPR